jgi:diguanylate cyclase (GGDEF)-like protein
MINKNIQNKTSKKNVIFIGILLSIVFWTVEAVLHFFLFQVANDGFLRNLFLPDLHELWMRFLVVSIIFLLVFYIHSLKERKKIENQLREAAMTDILTGCLNRRGFFTLAEHQCRISTRSKKIMALLYLDVDGLKMINDRLGHEAGGQALVDIATIFKTTFRSSDIIARIGGDEFAVLLPDLPNPNDENTVIRHLQDKIKKHNELGIRNYKLEISIGVAYYRPENPCSISKLLSQADELMYQNKVLNR